jgi:hypothetical protein
MVPCLAIGGDLQPIPQNKIHRTTRELFGLSRHFKKFPGGDPGGVLEGSEKIKITGGPARSPGVRSENGQVPQAVLPAKRLPLGP